MSQEQKDRLTKEWIITMLYQSPKTLQNLLDEGCRVMIFGQDYDNIVKLLTELQEIPNALVEQSGVSYMLTTRGSFEVKKHTILPLVKLTENRDMLEAFILANREKCDIEFLESLSEYEAESGKTGDIKQFGVQNYDKIATILNSLSQSDSNAGGISFG